MLLINILNFGLLFFSLLAVLVPNPVYSVIFLIFSLFSTAGLLLLLNVEFLAFILLIVYVGAIAILFLFIIMMLNLTNFKSIVVNWFNFLGITAFVTIFYFFFIYYSSYYFNSSTFEYQYRNWIDIVDNYSNIQVIGHVLYTDYFSIFIASGFVLLVAMIGAIVVTSGRIARGKKQLVNYQLTQTFSKNIRFQI